MANFRALPMATVTLDEESIVRAMEWHDKLAAIDKDIQGLTMVIIECLVLVSDQTIVQLSFSMTDLNSQSRPIGGTSEVALPRPDDLKHYVLVITGCPPSGTEEQDNKVSELVLNAPTDILGESQDFLVLPPGLDNLQDPKKVSAVCLLKKIKIKESEADNRLDI